MYINLLYLPLFNFAHLFFLYFLSFPLNVFVSFIFIALFPNWHLALVLFSSLCFSQFCSGRYNFRFPLYAGSSYCTLFLLNCFDFAYQVYIYMCIFSNTFYCCYKPLPLHWAFAVLWSFPFFFLLFFFVISFFKTYYIFSTFIPLFAFPTVLFPLQLIFNVYKSSSSTSI